jgi:hypothetical protein
VKPYVKTNKSDYIDAEAIAEAVGRPRMRFVPIKADDQLDLQSLHRVWERWVVRRTAVINRVVACCSNVGSLCARDDAMSMRHCQGYWKTPTPSYRVHCAGCWLKA